MRRSLIVGVLLAVAAAAQADPLPPCLPGATLTLSAVGDVLIHRELQAQAWTEEQRFAGLWAPTRGLIARADLAYANLEGPLAPGLDAQWRPAPDPGEAYDGVVYSGYRRFNYHPRLALDLRASGFDIVSTANNHALDRGPRGVELTIDALETAQLPFVGTRRGESGPWVTETAVGPWRVAWIACAAWLNRNRDDAGQVLECHVPAERARLLADIRRLRARADVHFIVFTPHWGGEYRPEPRQKQIDLAREAVAAGVDLVVGNHPHVLQPWIEEESGGRRAWVLYSLGNFVSHQQKPARRATAMAFVGLTPDAGGRLRIGGLGYVPLHTRLYAKTGRYVTQPLDPAVDPEAQAVILSRLGEARRLAPTEAGRRDCAPPR